MDTLILSDLPEWRAEGYMYKMGLEPLLLKQIGRHFKFPRNSSLYAKRLFACVQHDLVDGKPVLRSGAEQTKLLRKICKAIEDRSKTRNTAVINSAEPQQIIFLTRDSFDVEEVFGLRQGNEMKSLMNREDSDINLAQRIANLVFRGLGDTIKEQTVSKNKNNTYSSGGFIFFSKDGMMLTIKFENEIPAGWKFGMPTTKFKDFKYNTRSFPILELKGPRGTHSSKFHMSHDAKEIAENFVRRYHDFPIDLEFKPITKKSFEEEKTKEEDRIKNQRIEKDKQERLKEETEFRNDYLSVAMKKHNIDIPLLPVDEMYYYSVFRFILQSLYKRVEDIHPQNNTALSEDLEYVWSDNTTILPFLVKKYGQEAIDDVKKIFNKIALGKSVWRNVYPWISNS
jgi:hypothetical protein